MTSAPGFESLESGIMGVGDNFSFINILFFFMQAVAPLCAHADLTLFHKKMIDPESTVTTQELRYASQSVASVGAIDSQFQIQVSSDFLQHTVDLPQLKQTSTVEYFLQENFGSHLTIQKENNGTATLLFDTWLKRDSILAYFKKYGFQISQASLEPTNIPALDELSEPGNSFCTSFYLGHNYFLTNHHCISTAELCSLSALRFNEELEPDLKTLKKIDAYRCKKIILSDEALDISLIEVYHSPISGSPDSHYPALVLTNRDPLPDERVTLVGHPIEHESYSDPKQNSVKKISEQCSVASTGLKVEHISSHDEESDSEKKSTVGLFIDWDSFFTHYTAFFRTVAQENFDTDCATVGGNSGSPVLDQHMHVIGIFNRATDGWDKDSDHTILSSVIPTSKIIAKYGSLFKTIGIKVITE